MHVLECELVEIHPATSCRLEHAHDGASRVERHRGRDKTWFVTLRDDMKGSQASELSI